MARMDKLELNGVKYISEDYLIEKMVEQVVCDIGCNDTMMSVYDEEARAASQFEKFLKYNLDDAELLKKYRNQYVLKRFIEQGMGS